MRPAPRIGVVGSANVDLTFCTPRLPRSGATLAGHSFNLGVVGGAAIALLPGWLRLAAALEEGPDPAANQARPGRCRSPAEQPEGAGTFGRGGGRGRGERGSSGGRPGWRHRIWGGRGSAVGREERLLAGDGCRGRRHLRGG